MYNLFIDDERFPANDGKDWKVVRSSQEAIDAVKRFGVPDIISFDHDLGGDDTSVKFINWLIDAVLDGEVQLDRPFEYVIHSQNPIGVKNIDGKLQSFFQHLAPKTENAPPTFKQFINEMTMRVGSYENLGRYLTNFSHIVRSGNHVGDIQEYKVYRLDNSRTSNYVVVDNDNIIAYFQLIGEQLETAYVMPEYRKQGLFSMFLFFLKKNEGLDRIVFGNRQSEDMIEAVKRIAKRFNVYWTDGEQKVPYDETKIDAFYSALGPTDWVLVLENNGDFSSDPKFWDPLNIKTWYEPFLE